MKFSIKTIAQIINGKIEGNDNLEITDFGKIEDSQAGCISFLANPKYENFIYSTKSSAVIVSNNFIPKQEIKTTLIRVEDAYLAMGILMQEYKKMIAKVEYKIEEFVKISESAIIDNEVFIGSFSYISENVTIGKNSVIYSNVFIGKNVKIGINVLIHPGAKIYSDTVISDGCIIHSGAVIGADGFGFAPDENGVYQDIPQLGNVFLAENVSIGANATVDRATMGSTKIGKGSKIDNHVQVGHNTEIGENTVVAALTGIAGSVKIGNNCMIGGLVGIGGHITIADGTKIGGHSGVSKSILIPNQSLSGRPILPVKEHLKVLVHLRNLNKI